MDKGYKIPLLASLKWSLQWTVEVFLRHPRTGAAYALAAAVTGLLARSGLGVVVLLLYALMCVPLALLAHAEVLRDPSDPELRILGQGLGTMGGYLLDTILIGLAVGLTVKALLYAILVSIMSALVAGELVKVLTVGMIMVMLLGKVGMVVIPVVLIAAVVAVIASRPALRLPSWALGDQLSWSQAWRLGKGNTLSLVVGMFLISALVIAIRLSIVLLLPETWADVVRMVLVPPQIVLTCAFLSVAYGQLRRANPVL